MSRMISSLCVPLQESSIVLFVGAVLVSCSSSHQATFQDASCLLTESLENGLYTSLLSQTIQGRNIPLQRTRTEIGAHNPPQQYQWLTVLCVTSGDQTSFPLLACIQDKHSLLARLYARTPYACTCTPVQATNTRLGPTPNTTYPSKKMLRYRKRWVTFQAVAQVNPTAQNTLGLYECSLFYQSF